ncbi:mechanosensitive ion channel family protein [Devosia sp.]|uniref:mechanosensitive ion channel family protein n=1 Tax=Devosia sp. TaxID=1871048 RepID=UPI003A8EA963
MRLLFRLMILALSLWPITALAQSGGSSAVFEVQQVNPGLPKAPDGVIRDTPQASLETFLQLADDERWGIAAHLLDLSSLDEQEQAERGPELARMLNDILERGMVLDWNVLPDRPDALDAFSASENPMSGEARRSIRLSLIDIGNRSVPIRISRLKPENGAPVWLFAKQTVENIPAMHDIYGPTDFEKALPGFLQATAFWTLAWWEVIAVPLVGLIAAAAALLAYSLLGRLRKRNTFAPADAVIEAVRLPVALLAFVAGFGLVRSLLFTFSGPVNAVITPLQTALIVIALVMIAVRGVDAVLDQVARRNLEDISDEETAAERKLYTNVSAARRMVIFVGFVAGIAIVLVQLNLHRTLGFSLLASAGVASLVVAFAARKVLADIMASLQIAIAKPARIGDAVLFADNWCYVEKIGFTYVQLRSWDHRRVIVPVSEFVSTTFENWSKKDAGMIKPVLLHLDPRANMDKLREVFQAFVSDADDILDKDDCKVQVIDQTATAMQVRFYISAANPSAAWEVHCRLREHMLTEISRLEGEAAEEGDQGVAYLPREREIQLETATGGEAD